MAVLRALNSCTTKYNEVQPLYNQTTLNQSERLIRNRHPVGSRGCDAIRSEASLGIFTKSLVAPKRVHDFILQDQSCKLLPKHRVCNCLKKRIDKNKNRTVKYNVDRKNPTGLMFNDVHLYGFVLFVLNQLPKVVDLNYQLGLTVGKRNF